MSVYTVPNTKICKNTSIYGLDESVKRSKYPKSVDIDSLDCIVTNTTNKLAQCDIGTGHDNFLNGIVVQFDLTFTNKAWVEAERYHFFDFVSSQSTMHKISSFDFESQCCKYVTKNTKEEVQRLLNTYINDPTSENYLYLLYNIPSGFKLTAGMTTNYRQLKTIYEQRHNHRLPEWRLFCKWITTLPHSEWITGGNNDYKFADEDDI